ncbi:MAG: preprotein translocase subunit YajC [Clostridiales bacterium]|nr:preprotein translocase subunit YajC [Clostridiales bacterium]
MINLLLQTAAAGGSTWWMIGVLGIFFVLMIVMTIIPQRKQKKKMAEMFNSLSVGDKVMTIGGFVGVITEIDAPNDKYIINVGNEENPVNVTVIKNAIRAKM